MGLARPMKSPFLRLPSSRQQHRPLTNEDCLAYGHWRRCWASEVELWVLIGA